MVLRTARQRLADILDAIDTIAVFTSGKPFADYERDRMLRDAVERNIERLSEASRRLPEETKAQHPHIPWRDIADIGNVLRHGYDQVAASEIWQVVTLDLAPLRAAVVALIAAIDETRDH